jgi:hypothetical protein
MVHRALSATLFELLQMKHFQIVGWEEVAPFHTWMLCITQATNYKFHFYEQMYIAYAIYRMQYKSITMFRCFHNSCFKVSKMTCKDKRYSTSPLSMVKSVMNINSPNILKTLCTTDIIRTFKIIHKACITT